MKTLIAAVIAAIGIGLAGATLFSKPYSTDCLKVNNNVRGSIEYRCECR